MATAVRGERRSSTWILLPITGPGRHFPFGAGIGGFYGRTRGIARKGVVRWNRKSSVAWKGAIPATVVELVSVTVCVFTCELKPGRGENGKGDKGESKSKFHLWGDVWVAAVRNSSLQYFAVGVLVHHPPRHLYTLIVSKKKTKNIFGGVGDKSIIYGSGQLSRAQFKSSA